MKALFGLLLASTLAPLSLVRAEAKAPNILFCIADDWSYPHAGAFGDRVIRTPNIDWLAAHGLSFSQAYCASPSCTPSRGAILAGRYPHQLEQGGNLWSSLPARFPVVPDLLEKNGYAVGHTRKGWGPGNFKAGGRDRNPAGPQFKNFDAFLESVPADRPFWFWFGSNDPHRPYEKGAGAKSGLDQSKVEVPACWPNTEEVRRDILDYYSEVERFDRDVGEILDTLRQKGMLENTVVIVTGDNGLPFPRAKANLYDLGTRVPLVVYWAGTVTPGRTSDAFVNLADLGPTFLEIGGVAPPAEMTTRTILPLLQGRSLPDRDHVFLERERHANVRAGDLSYPMRAVRTRDFLYIRNLRPDRWPAGDPEPYFSVGAYGDCDNSPTKSLLLDQPGSPYFKLAFGLRPAEELYAVGPDPSQTNNLAQSERYQKVRSDLSALLDHWMKDSGDPRVDPSNDSWSHYEYFGGPGPKVRPNAQKSAN